MHLCLLIQDKDKYGITPLLSAVWEGHRDAVKLLLQNVSILWCSSACRVLVSLNFTVKLSRIILFAVKNGYFSVFASKNLRVGEKKGDF